MEKKKNRCGREKAKVVARRGFGREDIEGILGEYVGSGRFREDFESLTPARRIGLMERMLPFVIGRVKSFNPAATESEQEVEIDDILRALMAETSAPDRQSHSSPPS